MCYKSYSQKVIASKKRTVIKFTYGFSFFFFFIRRLLFIAIFFTICLFNFSFLSWRPKLNLWCSMLSCYESNLIRYWISTHNFNANNLISFWLKFHLSVSFIDWITLFVYAFLEQPSVANVCTFMQNN